MVVINTIRNMIGIRRPRRIAPAGPQPQLGSNVVNGHLRMRLKYPITNEQWHWLSQKGWRTVDMRHDRRHYLTVDDQSVLDLISVDTPEERETIHSMILGRDEFRSSRIMTHRNAA
ncbi:MAG: hypothetical protein RL748_287 [Pseudomonadota bacterium]